jgi:hypothetical protein
LIGSTAYTTITGDTTGNLLNVDPLLMPLANNGGATQTHALQANSPAIDAADPAKILPADQRGVSRPVDGDGNGAARADIGAVEAGILVTNTNDGGAGSLRQAVADSNSTAANDEIRFSALFGKPRVVTLTGGELVLANNGNLIINGTGAENLTISGNNQSRVFSINAGTNATISNITVANGSAGNGNGGGILNNVVLTLNNSVVRNNTVNPAGSGGGIYNSESSMATLTNIIVRNNSAVSGGGIGSAFESRVVLSERAQCRRRRPWQNHINLCLRAFLRIESHCYRTGISWFEAKTSIIRAAVRAYLANPLYSLIPTA